MRHVFPRSSLVSAPTCAVQSYRASRPIPAVGTLGLDTDLTDLIFLPGKTRTLHSRAFRIFVGCSKEVVETSADADKGVGGPGEWDLECSCETLTTPSKPSESLPPGVAGRHMVAGVEEDVVCGAGRRYALVNLGARVRAVCERLCEFVTCEDNHLI